MQPMEIKPVCNGACSELVGLYGERYNFLTEVVQQVAVPEHVPPLRIPIPVEQVAAILPM